MNAFDYLIKFMWEYGIFTIALPFLLVLVFSFYFFRWLIEEKYGKKGKKPFLVLRYALTVACALITLYASIFTTSIGAAAGFIIGWVFLIIFFLFIFVLLMHFMGWEDIAERVFGK